MLSHEPQLDKWHPIKYVPATRVGRGQLWVGSRVPTATPPVAASSHPPACVAALRRQEGGSELTAQLRRGQTGKCSDGRGMDSANAVGLGAGQTGPKSTPLQSSPLPTWSQGLSLGVPTTGTAITASPQRTIVRSKWHIANTMVGSSALPMVGLSAYKHSHGHHFPTYALSNSYTCFLDYLLTPQSWQTMTDIQAWLF